MVNLMNVLATCGNGYKGRLGHGISCASQQFLRIVGSLCGYQIKSVACGGAHTAVVTDDGSLFTFGMNDKGQLGHSEKDKFVAVPLEVGLPDPVAHVAAGDHHTLCITTAGEVWAWGSHESGQLGIGPTSEYVHRGPRLVKELQGARIQQVSAGAEHSLALGSDGRAVWCWGSGSTGALGMGAKGAARQVQWSPRQLRGPLDGLRVLQLAAGLYNSGAVDDAGRCWTWGHGIYWQLGHGTADNEMLPRQVASLTNVASLALGHQSGWALSRDGRAFCWGTDEMGSLAQGEGHWQKVPMAVPQELRSLPRSKAIAAGWKHALAIGEDGGLYSWGWAGAYNTDMFSSDDNSRGQLGLGDGRDHWAPTRIQRIHTSSERFYDLRMSYLKPWKALQVSCGRNHTAAVLQVHLDVRDVGA